MRRLIVFGALRRSLVPPSGVWAVQQVARRGSVCHLRGGERMLRERAEAEMMHGGSVGKEPWLEVVIGKMPSC